MMRPLGGSQENVGKIDEEMCNCSVNIAQEFPAYTLKKIRIGLARRLPNKPGINQRS